MTKVRTIEDVPKILFFPHFLGGKKATGIVFSYKLSYISKIWYKIKQSEYCECSFNNARPTNDFTFPVGTMLSPDKIYIENDWDEKEK